MTTLYELVERVQKEDEEAIEELLRMFSPKVERTVRKAPISDREDLKQELNLKLVQAAKAFSFQATPGFWEGVSHFKK